MRPHIPHFQQYPEVSALVPKDVPINQSQSPRTSREGNTRHKLLHDGVRVWFECVESEANWSDGTSREAAWDSFRVSHGLSHREILWPTWPWSQQDCSAFEFRFLCRLEQRWTLVRNQRACAQTTDANTRNAIFRVCLANTRTSGRAEPLDLSAVLTAQRWGGPSPTPNGYVPFTVEGGMGRGHTFFMLLL